MRPLSSAFALLLTPLLALVTAACDDGSGTEPPIVDASLPDDARVMLDAAPPQMDAEPTAVDASPDQAFVVDSAVDASVMDAQPIDAEIADMAMNCAELPPGEGGWLDPFESPRTVSGGAPHHSAVAPVVNPNTAFTFDGKFAYGVFSEDLEEEWVEVWIRARPCGAWARFERVVTDLDGRISVAHPGFPVVGEWDFRLRVPGDDSRAAGVVRVVEPGREAVVFDIDGTLTIGDREIFEEILLGNDPEMYPAANRVVQRWADAGYFIVYITGRPYFLNPTSQRWLVEHDFPAGPVRTTDSLSQTLPTTAGVQTFKREWLEYLTESAGLRIVAAYGNAETDICAYAQAGVDPQATWIIGPEAGGACEGFAPTQPIADYPAHLPSLQALPPAQR